MINYYRVTFSSGVIYELIQPKLTSRDYHEILDELIFLSDFNEDQRVAASVYCNNSRIAIIELITWEDGTADIYIYGQKVRGLYKEEGYLELLIVHACDHRRRPCRVGVHDHDLFYH